MSIDYAIMPKLMAVARSWNEKAVKLRKTAKTQTLKTENFNLRRISLL